MKTIRIRVMILACWLVIFYIIGSMLHPILTNILTIGLSFVIVLAAVAIPQMSIVPLWVMMFFPITVLLLARFWAGELAGEQALFLPIIDILGITITVILSRWVGLAFNEVESAFSFAPNEQENKMPEPIVSGEGAIYREVRRARNHQRPLALLSISIDEKTLKPEPEQTGQEFQGSMLKNSKLHGLSKMLCDELEDCSIIVLNTDHYLAVLPETLPEEITFVVDRLRQKACSQVGVEIKIGAATLPEDSFTFEGLIDKASQLMQNDRAEALPCLDVGRILTNTGNGPEWKR